MSSITTWITPKDTPTERLNKYVAAEEVSTGLTEKSFDFMRLPAEIRIKIYAQGIRDAAHEGCLDLSDAFWSFSED